MRALWKGALSFGLVNIPVHMYTASREKEFKFIMLHNKDMSEIRYARICKVENTEIPWNEIVKGYEYEKGNYIVLKDEDFEKANLKKSKTIEIVSFIDEEEVNTIYYVKPYFLEPEKNAASAYVLLREALEKSKKVGLARYVLRNHEHLGVVKTYNNLLILNELRYHADLIKAKDIEVPSVKKATAKEMDIALQLIDQQTVPFAPEQYIDSYEEEMKEIIRKKAKGKPVRPKTEEPEYTKVQDIMSLLKASLKEKKKPEKIRKTA